MEIAMKTLRKTMTAMCIGLAAMGSLSTIAEDVNEHTVMINVNKTGDANSVFDIKIDGVEDSFEISDLALGETKTFTTDSGKVIVATKTEEGMNLTVDGKEIKLPSFGGKFGTKLHRSMPFHHSIKDTVQVSGVELDETQRQIILDAFAAAGINKKVSFTNNNVMFIKAGSLGEDGGQKVLQWNSGEDSNFEVIVEGDENANVEVHKMIRIETLHEDKDKDKD